jgi:hypothetical protein
VASGKKRAVLARHVRNRRLYDAIDHWALCAITNSLGAGALLRPDEAVGRSRTSLTSTRSATRRFNDRPVMMRSWPPRSTPACGSESRPGPRRRGVTGPGLSGVGDCSLSSSGVG